MALKPGECQEEHEETGAACEYYEGHPGPWHAGTVAGAVIRWHEDEWLDRPVFETDRAVMAVVSMCDGGLLQKDALQHLVDCDGCRGALLESKEGCLRLENYREKEWERNTT